MEAAARTLAQAHHAAQPQQQAAATAAPTQAAPAHAPAAISIAPTFIAPAGGLEGYDMSSLDQLQAHALQLSASAGLTNLLLPAAAGQHAQQAAAAQQAQGTAQAAKAHQSFIFLQPAGATHGLPALAALGAAPTHAGQAPAPGSAQQTQSYIIAGPNGAPTSITAPAGLGHQIFAAATAGGPATLAIAPNGTLQSQHQSYSSAGIPIPMPMLIPQPQQQQQQATQIALQQQPQFAPLQPAPPPTAAAPDDATGAAAAALAGTKRMHDSSVVSQSTASLESNPGSTLHSSASNGSLIGGSTNGNSSSMNMNMNDFPEFQLRNKDGSIITEKDLEKMSPAERRRYERNLREQQRSFRISQQIQQLRDVLSESKVPFKPNKYSILVSVADYIKQLQTRAIMLDSEHKKLFKTIQETNEMVASGQIPDASPAPADGAINGEKEGTGAQATNEQGELLFVQGLDYQAVFEQTPTANGVASIDGRILTCNKELESILETTREHIERQSLFTLVQNHQEIFEAMAELLKRADALSNGSLKADPVQLLYWSGRVVTPTEKKLGMHITLACTKDGSPKFFSFCMSPA
ncbi:expressed unknown protein [Seminavis robusta]|uniref:BHLH domain-containing protein n=1 Tax=Seminavis robusta TaxID=568900 RepID=A0A9N8DZJ7_9STRA|nr:expressed unknown protein [Seminavis robusta]|eukprot:Sro503_g155830.1 n/a (579) ;mRNA; f:33422-35258